jgi:hypothetical protein
VTDPIALSSSPSGGVSTDTSRLASKENLAAAGQRFEAVFTGMMLKSMRQAKLGDGPAARAEHGGARADRHRQGDDRLPGEEHEDRDCAHGRRGPGSD